MSFIPVAVDPEDLPIPLSPIRVAGWLRVDADDIDELKLINDLIQSAMDWAEGEANQPLFEKEYRVDLKAFENGDLGGFIVSDLAVSYRLVEGEEPVPLNEDQYTVDRTGKITFNRDIFGIAGIAGITISYKLGYTVDALPQRIIQAMRLIIAQDYDNRSDSRSYNETRAKDLLQRFKRIVV